MNAKLTATDILANPISTPALLIGSTIAIGGWAFGFTALSLMGLAAVGAGIFVGFFKASTEKDQLIAKKIAEAKTEERRDLSQEYSKFKQRNANRKTDSVWKDCLEDLNGILYLYNRVSPDQLEKHIELVDPIHATFRQCMSDLKQCRELDDFAKRSPTEKKSIKKDFNEKLGEVQRAIKLLNQAVREFHEVANDSPEDPSINPLDEVLEVRKRMRDREERFPQQIDRE